MASAAKIHDLETTVIRRGYVPSGMKKQLHAVVVDLLDNDPDSATAGNVRNRLEAMKKAKNKSRRGTHLGEGNLAEYGWLALFGVITVVGLVVGVTGSK